MGFFRIGDVSALQDLAAQGWYFVILGQSGFVFFRFGTIWVRILSSWDKLGGFVQDWRRFGVTGFGCPTLGFCRLGTKWVRILSLWDNLRLHFVLLGQTGWVCSGLETFRRYRIWLPNVGILSSWDKVGSCFVALGQSGFAFCPLGTNWVGLFRIGDGSALQDLAAQGWYFVLLEQIGHRGLNKKVCLRAQKWLRSRD